MKNFLLQLKRGLNSERLKHQNTFMFWVVLITPILLTTITFLIVYIDGDYHANIPSRYHFTFNYTPYFHIYTFLQILFIVNVHYIEHKNHTWKNLYVIPVPVWTLFFSRYLFVYAVVAINVLLFYSCILLSEFLLGISRPELGFQHGQFAMEAFLPSLKFFLASSAVTSIMFWVGHHFKSILTSVVIGLLGYASGFVSFLLTNKQRYDGFPFAKYHPFNFGGLSFGSFGTGNHFLGMEQVYLGLGLAILITVLHYQTSKRTEILA